jgi:protein-S-isoprenylcysteine O-methyltransferase Ste14
MSGHDHIGAEPVNARIFPIPPIVAALFAAAGWGLNRVLPLTEKMAVTPFENIIAGIFIITLALAIGALAMLEMRRARTSWHPGAKASAFVQSGVYSRTRNPMYLALTLIVAGLGIASVNPWMVVMGALLMIYLQERVVKREEAYLVAKFGKDYDDYRKRVRRWF